MKPAFKKEVFTILLSILLSSAMAQVTFRELHALTSDFNEISGIEHQAGGAFWAINDGGNSSTVHLLDTSNSIHKKFEIDAPNIDWEDLSSSSSHLFIGDFGNNGNSRKNLVIHKILKDSLKEGHLISTKKIHFSYEDQNKYPPSSTNLNFDCEAFFYYNDSLYLFSKNRTSPFDGWIKMYRLPSKPGTYVAELIDSMQYRTAIKEIGWITSADVYKNKFILLGSSFIIEQAFDQKIAFDENKRNIGLTHFSQKESVTFIAKNQILLADEKFNGLPGPNLYSFSWAKTSSTPNLKPSSFKCWVADQKFNFIADPTLVSGIQIFNLRGVLVHEVDFETKVLEGSLALKNLKSGSYFAIFSSEEGLNDIVKFIWYPNEEK